MTFKPGQSGNPKGTKGPRPNARLIHKLDRAFLRNLPFLPGLNEALDGPSVGLDAFLLKCAVEEPLTYLELMLKRAPREVKLDARLTEERVVRVINMTGLNLSEAERIRQLTQTGQISAGSESPSITLESEPASEPVERK